MFMNELITNQMKRILTSGILCFILVFTLSAQQNSPITVEKKGLKKIYLQDGETIDFKQVSAMLKSDLSSAKNYKSYKTNNIVGLSTITCGTVFIGIGFYYTIKSTQAVGDNDLAATTDYSEKSGNYMLIGAGFYVLSVPFILMANSNFKKSINLYNSSSSTSHINKLDLYFGLTGEGMSIGLKF